MEMLKKLLQQKQHGAALLIFVILFLGASTTLTTGLGRGVYQDIVRYRTLEAGKESYFGVEAAIEDAIYRILGNKNYDLDEEFNFGDTGVTIQKTVEEGPKYTFDIYADSDGRVRTRRFIINLGFDDYGYRIHADRGGVSMDSLSSITGDVYSNGPVTGGTTAGGIITGEVTSASGDGITGNLSTVEIYGDAYTETIQGSTIHGSLYCVTLFNTAVDGTAYCDSDLSSNITPIPPGPESRPFVPLPISDTEIDAMRSLAEAGGTYDCGGESFIEITSDTTLGTTKIPCDVTVTQGVTLTLIGPVWVEGGIHFLDQSQIVVNPPSGGIVPIIAFKESDTQNSSYVSLDGHVTFSSPDSNSFALLVGMNSDAEDTGESEGSNAAIHVSGNDGDSLQGNVSLYAPHGKIRFVSSPSLATPTILSAKAYAFELTNTNLVTAGEESVVGGSEGSGEEDEEPEPEPEPEPQILTFSPSSLEVIAGESVTLTWNSENTSSCEGDGGNWSGLKATSDSETVVVSETVMYTLTCTGNNGNEIQFTTFVTAHEPSTLDFSASSLEVVEGETVTLLWNSESTNACEAVGEWSDSTLSDDFEVVTLSETTTYTLTCEGDGGSIEKSVTVTAFEPPTLTLGASSNSVTTGEEVTFTWDSQNTNTCEALGGSWTGTKFISDSENVTVSETTTYTLTCEGDGGSIEESVTVTAHEPATLDFSASSLEVVEGEEVILTWNSENTSSCEATGGAWAGPKVVSDSESVTVSETTTYVLACDGGGGPIQQEVTVTAVEPESASSGDTFTQTKYGVYVGGSGLYFRSPSFGGATVNLAAQNGWGSISNTVINGDVYSAGYVSGPGKVTGNVVSLFNNPPFTNGTEGNGHIQNLEIGGDANAATVRSSNVHGDLYCNYFSTTISADTWVDGNIYCNTGSAGSGIVGINLRPPEFPPILPFPIQVEKIQTLKTEVTEVSIEPSSGSKCSSGTYTITSDTVLGAQKIECNVVVSDNIELTLKGSLWVSGNMYFNPGASVVMDPSLSGEVIAIVADNDANHTSSGYILLYGNNTFTGAGNGSYVLLTTMHNMHEYYISGGAAPGAPSLRQIGGVVSGDVGLYAPNRGFLDIAGSGSYIGIAANQFNLQNTANITVGEGIANVDLAVGSE